MSIRKPSQFPFQKCIRSGYDWKSPALKLDCSIDLNYHNFNINHKLIWFVCRQLTFFPLKFGVGAEGALWPGQRTGSPP
jgi:hypothetical protein